jgi:hypothetical protein
VSNTHYAVLVYAGDFDDDHDGKGPEMTLIAAGPEQFCWDAITRWTAAHALRPFESAEVVARDPQVVANEVQAAAVFRAEWRPEA